MSSHLTVDRTACAGHGRCYSTTPELVDADEQGNPVVLLDPVPEHLLPTARKLLDMCPELALSLETAGG